MVPLWHFLVLIAPTNPSCSDPASYIARLQSYFANLPPMSPYHQTVSLSFRHWRLDTCFAQDDSVCGLLTAPYKGRTLLDHQKSFKLEINGHIEIVSANKFKRTFQVCYSPSGDIQLTACFKPMQHVHMPLHAPEILTAWAPSSIAYTALTPHSLTPPLSPLQPASNKPYITKTDRIVCWPKKLPKTIYI